MNVVKISIIFQYLLFTVEIQNVILNDLTISAAQYTCQQVKRGVLALIFFHLKHWQQVTDLECNNMGPMSDTEVCKMGATSDRFREVCNTGGQK